jgi:hypothetical protein
MSRGTRPVDPVGDIQLMVILMKDITNTMQDCSSAHWLGSGAPINDLLRTDAVPDHAFYEATFVAVLVQAVDIDGMFALAASALQAVRTAAEKRGLTLNMQAGKTELLCAIVGAGAHQAQIPLADQNHLMPVNLSDHSHSLRVVQTYRHLGGWVHAAC